MRASGKSLTIYVAGFFCMVSVLVFCMFFPAKSAVADPDGSINLIGEKGVCVVDGDLTKLFNVDDPIEVSRFNKPYATGYVAQINTTYMVVKVESRLNDYFVQIGDIVHKPLPKEKVKLKMLSSQIIPKSEEGITVDQEKAAATEDVKAETDGAEVVVPDENATKSGSDVQSLLYNRAKSGGYIGGDKGAAKQGQIIQASPKTDTVSKEETPKVEPDSKPKETKANSSRRKKVISEEEKKTE
jgi:hypothetical protein